MSMAANTWDRCFPSFARTRALYTQVLLREWPAQHHPRQFSSSSSFLFLIHSIRILFLFFVEEEKKQRVSERWRRRKKIPWMWGACEIFQSKKKQLRICKTEMSQPICRCSSILIHICGSFCRRGIFLVYSSHRLGPSADSVPHQ